MIAQKLSRRTLAILSFAPAVIVGGAILIGLPWLRAIPDALAMAVIITATLVMIAASLYFSTLASNRSDEVQLASARFGLQHGVTAGYVAIAVLLCIPPAHDFIVSASNNLALALKGNTEKAPMLAFVGGVVALTFAQTIGIIVFCSFWWRSKSR